MASHVPPPRKADSWAKILEFFNACDDSTWIFRGVSSSKHLLVPKIGRKDTHNSILFQGKGKHAELKRMKSIKQREEEIFKRFKLYARPHLTVDPQSDWHWLALAQHHGLPTRLLDWTSNPLVATYFSVLAEPEDNTGIRIYAIRAPEFVDTTIEKEPFKITDIYSFSPPHITSRISAQQGIFTVHPSPFSEYSTSGLTYVTIAQGMRQDIQLRLHRFGINHATLFPDLDGVSSHLSWRLKRGIGVGPKSP
jgi:FRG domain